MGLIMRGIKRKIRRASGKVAKVPKASVSPPRKLFRALRKEAELGPALHQDVLGALRRMQAKDPALGPLLRKARGYAVFPGVGKASALIGGAFGMGEVFEAGGVIGYAAIVQVTLGVQVGGQTFHELIVFDTREALSSFKRGKVELAANASAVIVKAGAASTAAKAGTRVFIHSEGGLELEAALGGQKFIYRPALLGRARTAKLPRVGAPAQSSPSGP